MTRSFEDMERLIVRKLDGEITPDEDLELSRGLVRDPEARALFDEMESVDRQSAASLRAAFDRSSSNEMPALRFHEAAARRRGLKRQAWWMVPGALAAGLLVTLMARPLLDAPSPSRNGSTIVSSPWSNGGGDGTAEYPAEFMHTVSDHRPALRLQRNVARDVIGLIGEDGNIYWFEVDRTTTVKRPNPRSAPRSADNPW